MEKHLYNSKLGKIFWFVQRFGIKEIFMKPLRIIFAPLIIKIKKRKRFIFDKKEYSLFYSKYNITWANERCVEIPVILNYIRDKKMKILEVGNVLSHYFPVKWDILDKYEVGKNVINKDILDYLPSEKYDVIISISTFEHIGYDDDKVGNSSAKILDVLKNLKRNCLKPGGKIIFTVPIGYNPELDSLIKNEEIDFKSQKFLKKFGKSKWIEVTKEEAMVSKYGRPYPYGNCIMIGEY